MLQAASDARYLGSSSQYGLEQQKYREGQRNERLQIFQQSAKHKLFDDFSLVGNGSQREPQYARELQR